MDYRVKDLVVENVTAPKRAELATSYQKTFTEKILVEKKEDKKHA